MRPLSKLNDLSLKIQIIIGITLIQGLISGIFIFNSIQNQKKQLENHTIDHAREFSKIYTMGISSFVLAKDYTSILEMNKKLELDQNTRFAIVYSNDGKIIAQSNNTNIGTILTDRSVTEPYNNLNQFRINSNNYFSADITTPILFKNNLIGWVRLGITENESQKTFETLVLKGIMYFIGFIFLGLMFSSWLATKLTKDLDTLMIFAKKISSEDLTIRTEIKNKNEIGQLSQIFNLMLDSLEKDKLEIQNSKALLHKSEERFELALKGTRDAIWDFNTKTGEVYFSDRWFEIFGAKKEDRNYDVSEWRNRVHPDDLAQTELTLNDHIVGKTPYYESEHRLRHNDGSYLWVIGRGTGVRDENGIVYRMVGTQSDITSQKNAIFEKEKFYNQLQQSQKMEAIGQLTGGIAHDFNNILAGIIGFSDLGIKQRLEIDDKTTGYLLHISKLANRARDLVKQMMIYSRGGDPDPKVISIVKIVEESLNLLSPLLSKNIKIITNFNNLNPKIKIDPIQLQQIITNLVLNARDAFPDNRGEIDISINKIDAIKIDCSSCGHLISGKLFVISIKDNGSGMDEAILKKVFEPFYTTKQIGKGTGMGLAMVHGIVHRQHGHVNVESFPGLGTVFKLYFHEATEVEDLVPLQKANQQKISNIKKRILVVDDEEFLRSFVSEFLTENGCDCICAENGEIALNILKRDSQGFDLVITDFSMPEMNGIELIEQIRKDWPYQPIILSSGNLDIALERDHKHLNIDAVLIKPYEIDEALAIINNILIANNKIKIA